MTGSESVGVSITELDSIDHVLYVARREIESIPYTAPEVIVARARELVPLCSTLVGEVRRLQTQLTELREHIANDLNSLPMRYGSDHASYSPYASGWDDAIDFMVERVRGVAETPEENA